MGEQCRCHSHAKGSGSGLQVQCRDPGRPTSSECHPSAKILRFLNAEISKVKVLRAHHEYFPPRDTTPRRFPRRPNYFASPNQQESNPSGFKPVWDRIECSKASHSPKKHESPLPPPPRRLKAKTRVMVHRPCQCRRDIAPRGRPSCPESVIRSLRERNGIDPSRMIPRLPPEKGYPRS